jgi:hypothetical protein
VVYWVLTYLDNIFSVVSFEINYILVTQDMWACSYHMVLCFHCLLQLRLQIPGWASACIVICSQGVLGAIGAILIASIISSHTSFYSLLILTLLVSLFNPWPPHHSSMGN